MSVPAGEHDGLRSSPLPLVSVTRVPLLQTTSELGAGLEWLLPPVTEPHTTVSLEAHAACVASVPDAERRAPPPLKQGIWVLAVADRHR
jgi:hypothetical protein